MEAAAVEVDGAAVVLVGAAVDAVVPSVGRVASLTVVVVRGGSAEAVVEKPSGWHEHCWHPFSSVKYTATAESLHLQVRGTPHVGRPVVLVAGGRVALSSVVGGRARVVVVSGLPRVVVVKRAVPVVVVKRAVPVVVDGPGVVERVGRPGSAVAGRSSHVSSHS